MRALGWFILSVLTVFGVIYGGFVFATIWGWFAVPLGVPALTIPHALGITTILGWSHMATLKKLATMAEEETGLEALFTTLVQGAILITLVWGFSFIVHWFM